MQHGVTARERRRAPGERAPLRAAHPPSAERHDGPDQADTPLTDGRGRRPGRARGDGPGRRAGRGRRQPDLRHLDDRPAAHHRPAGPGRRRLPIHRPDPLRSAGRLGTRRRGPARQDGPGLATAWEGDPADPQGLDLPPPRGRDVPRRLGLRCRRGDLELRQGAEQGGAAFRPAAGRPGPPAPARGRELPEARRQDHPGHHEDARTACSPTRCSGS